MPLSLRETPKPFLKAAQIAAWREVRTAIVGDELNRTSIRDAGLVPLGDGTPFAGLALTVDCMVGENSALHHALWVLAPGPLIVAGGHRHVDTALRGEIMPTCAKARRAAAVIIDGAMRDRAQIAAMDLPAYVQGVSPKGPRKGWGGSVNSAVSCGGVPVDPGDPIVGDADGIVVVRPDQIDGLLERCRRRAAKEDCFKAEVATGKTTVEVLGMPAPEKIGV